MFTIKGTRETLPAADSHSFTQVLLEVWREKQSQGTGLPILDIERLVMKCNTRDDFPEDLFNMHYWVYLK